MPVSRVVRVAEVRRETSQPIPALEVNAEKFLPVQSAKFTGIPSLASPNPVAVVQTPVEGNDAAIVVDMGKMVLGCPYFQVEGSAGARIDVSLSEYLVGGRVIPSRLGTDVMRTNLTDRITLREGVQEWQREDYSGYRYIQLTVRDARRPVTFRKVGTVLRKYRFTQEADFRSSDPTLDQIFDLAKWSHRVNTHWGYCGSAWREHAQWSDLVWPALNESVFNDAPAMRYYLRQITLSQDEQGRMRVPYPGRVNSEFPEQTMWLARMLWDSGLYFGDLQLLRDLLPRMVKANEWFKKHLAPDGLITTAGGWQMLSLIDWGYPLVSFKERGELATLNLIYYKYLRSVERIAAELGENPISQTFQRQADSLRETINRTYFSPEEARYYDKPGHQALPRLPALWRWSTASCPRRIAGRFLNMPSAPRCVRGKLVPGLCTRSWKLSPSMGVMKMPFPPSSGTGGLSSRREQLPFGSFGIFRGKT